jgi:hypothetical protein
VLDFAPKEGSVMARKSNLVLVFLLLSLVSVGLWAQSRRDPTAPTVLPGVLSGESVGIRVTGHNNGKVTGTLVVKINGEWVDVESSMGRVPMTSK